MIIEFIGSTGAGKSTLISQVESRFATTTNVTTPFNMIASQVGLLRVTNPTAQNMIQEIFSLSYLIRSLPRYKASIAFSLRMLARKADSAILTINNLRSLVRKIGVYEFIRRHQQNRIILVDDGTVLLAHGLFVYNGAYFMSREIAEFASLIPLPDVIVYVRAPVDTLVKRSLQRSDPPREMKSKDPRLIEKYVNDAVIMFEQLIETEEIRDRVVIVDNLESAEKQSKEAAEFVTELVLSHQVVPYDNN
ncbi:MAG: hypothetical protein R3293_02255 [Candidatus Promineifilaceae bacterium]|nr:hypothetical protein [Candidatus Promineifilaceae bacterium]